MPFPAMTRSGVSAWICSSELEATVTVVEPLYRWTSWKITASSRKWVKKDAQTIEFEVPVPKDGEASLTYTVKYSW